MSGWVDGAAILVWNVFARVIWVTGIVEVFGTPTACFANGWRTKLGRLLVVTVFAATIAGLYLPVGAAVVLAALRRTRRDTETVDDTAARRSRLPR